MRPPLLLTLAMALLTCMPVAAETPKRVRAIALGPKVDLAACQSVESYRAEVERLMTKAHREFAPAGPNLVVFGGDWGMLGALTGNEHQAARSATTRAEAYEALRQAHAWELLWTRATTWGVPEERALMLSLSDRLYRPLATTFSEAARRHGAYVLACATVADVDGLKPFQSLRTFSDRPVSPVGRDVYRKALLFDPDGRLVGEVKQVHSPEGATLSGGSLDAAHPFDLPFGKVGVALGADARDPAYVSRLDEEGCQILLQPAMTPGTWAESSESGEWHPQEWLEASLGSLQASGSTHLQYTVTPMPTGLWFDTVFDGQSSIMGRSDREPSPLFVGVDLPAEGGYRGDVLAMAPWVVEDPKVVHGSAGPATSLSDRQEYLRKVAKTLLRGGKRENQFVESIATADLAVR